MTQSIEVRVPDIGSDSADLIEWLVQPGDVVAPETALCTLESAKATMEVPSPAAGKVLALRAAVGDKISEGALLLILENTRVLENTQTAAAVDATPVDAVSEAPSMPAVAAASPAGRVQIDVPDVGSDKGVTVIEINIREGDEVVLDQTLVTLESDKATMEVPATVAGRVLKILLKVGDVVSQGAAICELAQVSALQVASAAVAPLAAPSAPVIASASVLASAPVSAPVATAPVVVSAAVATAAHVHAGPAVRRLARELGVALAQVTGSGPKSRILKEDVHGFVKTTMQSRQQSATTSTNGLPALPVIDFSKWGEVELRSLTKIQKISAQNLHRAWVTIPHVTQFDEADITDMEAFRQQQKDVMKAQGVSLTPLAFLVKASAHVLKQLPKFNSSLASDGENLVWKHYIHIGVAVDTPNGLVVPVIRHADGKSVSDIARELAVLSAKAREKKLTPAEMSGATFSISSLGGIGGTAFTPIVNWPEVAILGVSRSAMKPVWDGKAFAPRLMLPLSLSYDHRVIDGADAARFTTALSAVLGDIRRLLL